MKTPQIHLCATFAYLGQGVSGEGLYVDQVHLVPAGHQ